MQSAETIKNPDDQNDQFKKLESLLRKSLKNSQLEVIDFTATNMLPPGENFSSIIIKLDAKVRRNKTANEEILHLVAKTQSFAEKPLIYWSLVYKKELFAYAELLPLYRDLERQVGIEESDLIDVSPVFVGSGNFPFQGDECSEVSSLLMENIMFKGFYLSDRRIGLDLQHAAKALTCLARYHAMGVVMKQRRPTFAQKAIQHANILGINLALLDDGYDRLLKTFQTIPDLSRKDLDFIEKSFENVKDGKSFRAMPTEPWVTITHGDFWINNIMFHKDDSGYIDDIKFIDFQAYLYNSPLKDLPRFFCGNLDQMTAANHLDELLNIYYDSFVETLKRMGCDISIFTRESFDRDLKNQAINEFFVSATSIIFHVHEVGENDKHNKELTYSIFKREFSDVYVDKLKKLLKIYKDRQWIC